MLGQSNQEGTLPDQQSIWYHSVMKEKIHKKEECKGEGG
tara:strand:+ start:8764 stop:8880 length:117 start_codon:yes stop_codon:yes gene_type:complete